jgi:hypothetical protein
MSLAGRIKFGNKYANEFNKSHRMTKEQRKEYDKKEREEWNKAIEEEDRITKENKELEKRIKSFGKSSIEDQQKVLDDIKKKADDLNKKGGHDNETEADSLMDTYYELSDKHKAAKLESDIENFDNLKTSKEKFEVLNNIADEYDENLFYSPRKEPLYRVIRDLQYNAGTSKCLEIEKMKNGPAKDKEWDTVFKDVNANYEVSFFVPYLIDKAKKESGDFTIKDYKTENSRKAGEKLNAFIESERKKDYFDADEHMSKYDALMEKYTIEVLKDTGLPVNNNSIQAMSIAINWYAWE